VRHSARKVPLTVGGTVASSTDPETWSTYREAAGSAAGVGNGFVLNGDGIACLDLDHALDADGDLLPWAAGVLELAPDCWVEVSRSGTGLHVWGRAVVEQGRRIPVGTGSVEIYGTGRYIAVTGRTWGGTPQRLGDLTHVINQLL
jgi:primase-polymerase (primpol)-like protein